jgi:endonuclease G
VSGSNFEYIANGLLTFYYVPTDGGTTKNKAATIAGNNASASLTGLTAGTSYTLYASCTATNGTTVQSQTTTFSTPKREVEVTSISYTELSDGYAPTTERAYLSAKYTATLGSQGLTPTAVGFCYGTSTTRADATSVTVTSASLASGSGSFWWWQHDLQPDTKYYWWAWVEVDGEKTYSDRKQFTTQEVASATPVVDASWLELPAEMTGTSYANATVWTVKDGSTRNYTIAYDTSKYATYWVAYNLKNSHMGSLSRPNDWNYDTSTGAPAESLQVNVTNTYTTYNNGAGHAKGHMIPNASRNGNETMQKQTFYYTNSVPQIHNGFNSGIWQSLEAALQTIGKSEEIFIVTGTAFSKVGESKSISYTSTKSDSNKSVPIPNYFYKVVLKVNSTSSPTSAKAIGFWFQNKAYSDTDYSSCAVSVDQIEKWTGLNFFVNLPDTIEESAESNASWSSFQSF